MKIAVVATLLWCNFHANPFGPELQVKQMLERPFGPRKNEKDNYNSVSFFILLLVGWKISELNTISFRNINRDNIPDKSFNDVVLITSNDTYSCATTSLAMIISEYLGMHNNPLDKDLVWGYSGSSISTIKSLGNDLEGLYKVCNKFDIKYEFIQNIENYEVEYLLSKRIYLVAFV